LSLEDVINVQTVTFGEAWKEFLLIRPVSNKFRMAITRDDKKTVVGIKIEGFKVMKMADELYIIDDTTCPGIVLAFPQKMIEEELKKVLGKLMGKTLLDDQLSSMKSKTDSLLKTLDSRLGCAYRTEIQQAFEEGDFWEVIFSLHQVIEYRLGKLIVFKSARLDMTQSTVIEDSLKQTICKRLNRFKHLSDIAYLLDAINSDERQRIINFDAERDDIAHKFLRRDISDDILKSACTHGLEVMDALESALSRIIPKPQIIVMNNFDVNELSL